MALGAVMSYATDRYIFFSPARRMALFAIVDAGEQ
jgi:hypothetical protein